MYYRLIGQNKFVELAKVLVKGVENLVKGSRRKRESRERERV